PKLDPPQGTKQSWAELASAFAGTAASLDRAAHAKDLSTSRQTSKQLTDSCMACHRVHRGMPGRGGFGGPRGGVPRGGPPSRWWPASAMNEGSFSRNVTTVLVAPAIVPARFPNLSGGGWVRPSHSRNVVLQPKRTRFPDSRLIPIHFATHSSFHT